MDFREIWEKCGFIWTKEKLLIKFAKFGVRDGVPTVRVIDIPVVD